MNNKMFQSNKKAIYLFAFVALFLLLNIGFSQNGPGNQMLVAAEKKTTDILFLKGKFIMKDKKGAIVISDEKKCHCPHYGK